MPSAPDSGRYARMHRGSRSRPIAWSHRRRFEVGLRLAARFAGGRLLDYGCGDGAFLRLLMAGPHVPAAAVGADLDAQADDCRVRLRADPRLTFARTSALDPVAEADRVDALVCMEVLEHVVDRGPVFDHWVRLVRPGGGLLVGVPVETGPAVVLNQLGRRVAGWRGIGDYPGVAPYTRPKVFWSLTDGRRPNVTRPTNTGPDGRPSHCHKGFDWRVLRDALAARFELERTVGSPVGWRPPGLGSRVWFVPRAPGARQ